MLTLNLRATAAAHAEAVHRLLTLSLLNRLCAPTPSTLARKRKIGVNSAPLQGKKRASGQEEKIYYMNKSGSFWELENRMVGRKKIMC